MLALTSAVVAAQPDGGAFSHEAQSIAAGKRKEIFAELSNLGDHRWAGSYYKGDGLGENVSVAIAPQSGYVFEWHGCGGLYGLNYGSVTLTNGLISLSFTHQNSPGFGGIAPRFIPVPWTSRHYLVPADDVIGFCNAVNAGEEPRTDLHGRYLLRSADEKKEAKGFPEVPGQYRPYLLAKPIEATITAVGPHTTRPSTAPWKFKDTPVTLDAGTDRGMLVGMELLVTHPLQVTSIRIVRVALHQSDGVLVLTLEDRGPKVGWRLSTRAPWHDPTRKPTTGGSGA